MRRAATRARPNFRSGGGSFFCGKGLIGWVLRFMVKRGKDMLGKFWFKCELYCDILYIRYLVPFGNSEFYIKFL